MKFKKGCEKPPGSGKKAGTPNKLTKQLKEMILGALDDAGGQKYLTQQARDNPGPFLALIGKVLPTTITPGEGVGKMTVTWERD